MPFVQTPRIQQLLQLVSARRPAGAKRLKPPTQPQPPLGYLPEFNCVDLEVRDIRGTIDRMHLEFMPEILNWGGAGTELANRLAGLSEDSIRIDCRNDCPAPEYTSESGAFSNPQGNVKSFMNICAGPPPFADSNRRSLVRFVVFRELIKLCGGNAVDVYGLYAYFVMTTRNASPISWMAPTPGQKSLMCAEGRRLASPFANWVAGTFMVWNNVAGIYRVGNKLNPDATTYNPLDFPNLGVTNWRQVPCP